MIPKSFTLLFAIVPITWAGSFIAAKFVVAEVNPMECVFWRFFLSAVVIFPWLLFFNRKNHPDLRKPRLLLHLLIVTLVAGVGYHVLFFVGLEFTTPSNAALIIALNPFLTAMGEIVVFKQARSPRFYLGFLLSLIGAIGVIISQDPSFQLNALGQGELLCFLAALSWAIYSIGAKVTKEPDWDALWINAYGYLFTALMIVPFLEHSLLDLELIQMSATAWAGLWYMAVFPTAFGYTLYYIGVQKKGPAWAASFIYLVPSITVVFDRLFFGAKISSYTILGTALVVSGLFVGNMGTKRS